MLPQPVGRRELAHDERLTLETAYCRANLRRYSLRLDLVIFFSTIFIVAGVKKAMTCNEVLDVIHRHTSAGRELDELQSAPVAAEVTAADIA